ncbi:phytanoyl-CoA dioxygenase family protein [Candidatus Poribacteria bacterium]|nr:phytanoyl-CoA dioxygenase family protein [Candidatus Poribacteria bacterium]MXV85145.1 phytanoyl-CoA dioxygenase family protein [Candidatus Poribacteria bacterium]MYA55540.1 phytanoyl-CoA dioxygenase family protein [Candidatus Poribacteria bacterium]
MNPLCLEHCLTETEKQQFEDNGFFAVEDAIPQEMVDKLVAAVDRVGAAHLGKNELPSDARFNLLDFVGRDDSFIELLDWPTTFPKVWGILGWNIKLYHSHLIVLPPLPIEERDKFQRLGWHQDSGRLNFELEGEPRPRISLKVAFFLTDTSVPGRGNFSVVPGSQKSNTLEMPDDPTADPEGAISVFAKPGTAVFFDRRLWHAAGRNSSDITRKVLFYGYSYRWLQPRDDMTVEHYMDRSDPIRQQILGKSTGGHGFTSPSEKDVPLRAWIQENLGSDSVAR